MEAILSGEAQFVMLGFILALVVIYPQYINSLKDKEEKLKAYHIYTEAERLTTVIWWFKGAVWLLLPIWVLLMGRIFWDIFGAPSAILDLILVILFLGILLVSGSIWIISYRWGRWWKNRWRGRPPSDDD